jgi:hypothetical protein
MKTKKKMPMYIAVQLESGKNRVWLPLPATQEQFDSAVEKIGGSHGNFIINEYAQRVPYLTCYLLARTPLSIVNHLAARLEELSDKDILKLCAIGDSEQYFTTVGQFVDYTYNPENYTLLPGICDEEMLGQYYIGSKNQFVSSVRLKRCIDRREFGRKLAELENGTFSPFGYVTSKIGWDAPAIKKEKPVPQSLRIKGYLGEDIYGNWTDCETVIEGGFYAEPTGV